MKSALFVGADAAMFTKVAELFRARGGTATCDAARLDVSGRTITVFAADALPSYLAEGPIEAPPGQALPDLSGARGLAVECRFETLFVDVIRGLAAVVDGPSWVLDNDGVAWDANEVDGLRVRL